MASDCKSPRKKRGKRGKERKWEDKTSPKAGRKTERQAGGHKYELKDRQAGTKTSRQKGRQKGVLSDCQFCRTQNRE